MSKCKAKAVDVDFIDLLFVDPCDCAECVARNVELESDAAEADAEETKAEERARCWKCGGSGKIAAYWRIDNGNCWACS